MARHPPIHGVYLQSRKIETPDLLELGYMAQEQDGKTLLLPVWHLSMITPEGLKGTYFSAQTGKEILWEGKNHLLPEPFGWEEGR